jgi:hypothetical protein
MPSANLGDDGFSLLGSATVMDHDLGTCLGEGQRDGAANAARGSRHEGGLA